MLSSDRGTQSNLFSSVRCELINLQVTGNTANKGGSGGGVYYWYSGYSGPASTIINSMVAIVVQD